LRSSSNKPLFQMPTVATRGSFDAPYAINPPHDMPIAAMRPTFTLP
jgi:hypothetical protein